MAIEVMLTLDLHTKSALQRGAFYKNLEDNGWRKLSNVDTAWTKRFLVPQAFSYAEIEGNVKYEVNSGAVLCDCKYDAWFLIGGFSESRVAAFSNKESMVTGRNRPIKTVLGS
ncbi:hypothetical protein [Vibrio harveyi]|uniref:hypothetical protein n=1 Tax=Vibrio harveyi TaxID=669 RepID=UPI003CF85865